MSCQLFPSPGGGFESFDARMLYCPFAAEKFGLFVDGKNLKAQESYVFLSAFFPSHPFMQG